MITYKQLWCTLKGKNCHVGKELKTETPFSLSLNSKKHLAYRISYMYLKSRWSKLSFVEMGGVGVNKLSMEYSDGRGGGGVNKLSMVYSGFG